MTTTKEWILTLTLFSVQIQLPELINHWKMLYNTMVTYNNRKYLRKYLHKEVHRKRNGIQSVRNTLEKKNVKTLDFLSAIHSAYKRHYRKQRLLSRKWNDIWARRISCAVGEKPLNELLDPEIRVHWIFMGIIENQNVRHLTRLEQLR